LSRRLLFALVAVTTTFVIAGIAIGAGGSGKRDLSSSRPTSSVPDGFEPGVLRAQNSLNRYFVVVDGPTVASRTAAANGDLSGRAQSDAAAAARRSQEGAIAATRSLGGSVVYRYDTLVDGFSASLSPDAVSALAARDDVKSVQPVSVVQRLNETSVPFIGAKRVWRNFGVRGQGMVVADVDTGIDYTHANFGGPGTVAAYEANDPNFIEPGTFPTKKVIGGYDFVGSNYDVVDGGSNEDPTNDTPRPDPDPLDGADDDHGSHTSGTIAGIGVPGEIGKGVAPAAKLLAIKVWDEGNSTDDVLVAGYERAMDPNDDGDTSDAADVLSFSGGVDYGTLNSVEARAAQRVVDLGTVFVASAGNSGNQAVGGSAYITGTPANARGVVSVAASIDEFNAQTITINSPPITLPDSGIMVQQDWGADLPPGGLTDDLFDGRELDPPANPGNETPADAQFCDPLPAGSLNGETVLVFKGATGSGDCSGSTKVFHAQNAGAIAVVMISLFGGAPSALASNGEPIHIPAVMISGNDGYAILNELSPGDPPDYNANTVNATLNDATTVIPQYTDAMTDFTSEGPARLTSDLKPDISAPGFDIQSTDAGTGDLGTKLSGTSMAAPHVSGVAVLLRQLHPSWPPERIKAVMMNHATQDMKDNLLGSPVSATLMGAGRVQADKSANASSVATPGSLSYGLDIESQPTSEVQQISVRNVDNTPHSYTVMGGGPRYSDFGSSPASVRVSTDGAAFGSSRSFNLAPNAARTVWVRLDLDTDAISEAEQEFGWYYFHPNVDGNVRITQSGGGNVERMHVPWHVAPLAASDNRLSESSLDLSNSPDTMRMISGPSAGRPYGDLYLLGGTDALESHGEEDVVAVGARSFTGTAPRDGVAEGVPTGTDALAGISWQDFLADPVPPGDPVEFGVQSAGVHNTTETLEVDVLVDLGADGVYAGDDEGIPADYLLVKQAAAGGEVCVFNLALANALDGCTATYFVDYSNYNSNLVGLVVDARRIGITSANSEIAYQATACTGRFSGDVPSQFCDTVGDVNPNTGVYEARLDVTDPALDVDPLVCRGFFGGGACSNADPIQVATGSAGPGDDPSILALFPNNAPSRTPTVVTTDTGP
jgi:minor extracellular serine protease Vpr